MMVSNRNLLFQGSISRFHVNLRGVYVFFRSFFQRILENLPKSSSICYEVEDRAADLEEVQAPKKRMDKVT